MCSMREMHSKSTEICARLRANDFSFFLVGEIRLTFVVASCHGTVVCAQGSRQTQISRHMRMFMHKMMIIKMKSRNN